VINIIESNPKSDVFLFPEMTNKNLSGC